MNISKIVQVINMNIRSKIAIVATLLVFLALSLPAISAQEEDNYPDCDSNNKIKIKPSNKAYGSAGELPNWLSTQSGASPLYGCHSGSLNEPSDLTVEIIRDTGNGGYDYSYEGCPLTECLSDAIEVERWENNKFKITYNGDPGDALVFAADSFGVGGGGTFGTPGPTESVLAYRCGQANKETLIEKYGIDEGKGDIPAISEYKQSYEDITEQKNKDNIDWNDISDYCTAHQSPRDHPQWAMEYGEMCSLDLWKDAYNIQHNELSCGNGRYERIEITEPSSGGGDDSDNGDQDDGGSDEDDSDTGDQDDGGSEDSDGGGSTTVNQYTPEEGNGWSTIEGKLTAAGSQIVNMLGIGDEEGSTEEDGGNSGSGDDGDEGTDDDSGNEGTEEETERKYTIREIDPSRRSADQDLLVHECLSDLGPCSVWANFAFENHDGSSSLKAVVEGENEIYETWDIGSGNDEGFRAATKKFANHEIFCGHENPDEQIDIYVQEGSTRVSNVLETNKNKLMCY
jgi:hypothetical protein